MMPMPIAAFILVLMAAGCQGKSPAPQAVFQPKFNFVTTGDAGAGRQAFSDLKCGTCHVVIGDESFQHPILEGPELGSAQSALSANEIADSIVAPSHVVSTNPKQDKSISPMGDYSNVMTVRQLVDLVAFVKAQPE
jgi:hypothetical protein